MTVYIVHIVNIEKASIELVTTSRDAALKKQIKLIEEHGPFIYVEVKEYDIKEEDDKALKQGKGDNAISAKKLP